MKLSLLATVALSTFTGSICVGGNAVYVGRGEQCGNATYLPRVNSKRECIAGLECKEGRCDFPSYLSPEIAECIGLLKAQGFEGQLGDYALYRGYCYPMNCRDLFKKISSCDNPKQACKDCQYCVDQNPSSECVLPENDPIVIDYFPIIIPDGSLN